MYLCDDGHPQICYDAKDCPACDLKTEIEDLRSEIQGLERQITDLEENDS